MDPSDRSVGRGGPPPGERKSEHRFFFGLLALFALIWAALAIAPFDRTTWTVQNLGIAGLLIGLALARRKLVFSRTAYACMFAFLCLAEIGAHYTYSLTPYDAWFTSITGRSFDALVGWERNNFDRIVHFAYGFLLAQPAREFALQAIQVRGFWSYALPVDLVMSTSMLFELIEWSTAELFANGEPLYVGTQGDVWDAQKDMALASLGALLAMCIAASVNSRTRRPGNRPESTRGRVSI